MNRVVYCEAGHDNDPAAPACETCGAPLTDRSYKISDSRVNDRAAADDVQPIGSMPWWVTREWTQALAEELSGTPRVPLAGLAALATFYAEASEALPLVLEARDSRSALDAQQVPTMLVRALKLCSDDRASLEELLLSYLLTVTPVEASAEVADLLHDVLDRRGVAPAGTESEDFQALADTVELICIPLVALMAQVPIPEVLTTATPSAVVPLGELSLPMLTIAMAIPAGLPNVAASLDSARAELFDAQPSGDYLVSIDLRRIAFEDLGPRAGLIGFVGSATSAELGEDEIEALIQPYLERWHDLVDHNVDARTRGSAGAGLVEEHAWHEIHETLDLPGISPGRVVDRIAEWQGVPPEAVDLDSFVYGYLDDR